MLTLPLLSLILKAVDEVLQRLVGNLVVGKENAGEWIRYTGGFFDPARYDGPAAGEWLVPVRVWEL